MKQESAADALEDRWYHSAIDAWLRVVLIALPVVTFGAFVLALVQGEGVWFALAGVAIVLSFYVAFLFPVRYGLTEAELIVHFGLIRQRIPYERIQSVKPTRNPLSSPALSLNRLQVAYGHGLWRSQRISPEERDGFLDELARRAGLRRVGDTLER